MSDDLQSEAQLTDDLRDLMSATPWNIALITHTGTIEMVSEPLLKLLGASRERLLGQPFTTLVQPAERARLTAAMRQATAARAHRPLRTHLVGAGGILIMAEIELYVAAEGRPALTAVIYPTSVLHRREQIVLQFNQLIPQLLAAASPGELYGRIQKTMQPLGIGMLTLALDPAAGTLRIEHLSAPQRVRELLKRAAQLDLAAIRIPADAPVFREVIEQQQTLFLDQFRPLVQALLPPHSARVVQALLWAVGAPGSIAAPLLLGAEVRGVLLVWGHAIRSEQAPFIEAFAHQIAALLAQLELRRQIQRQMQQLMSLAVTAQAVTGTGLLAAALRTVCEQAHRLFDANYVTIARPVPGAELLECVMAFGAEGERWIGARGSYDTSIAGNVMRSGHGICVPSVALDPRAHAAFRDGQLVRSSMAQPLLHQGAVLGVLTVGHRTEGQFGADDLEHLGRYAEYAAIAIANAELHSALLQSEAEQRRQRRELAALLQFNEAINASLDLATVLHEGLRVLAELGLLAMGGVYLATPHGTFELHASHNVPAELLAEFKRVDITQLAIGRTLLDATSLRAVDAETIARINALHPALIPLGITSMCLAPLVADGQMLGVLIVNYNDGQPLGDDEQRLIETVAQQLAQAIAKAQVHKALHTSASANAQLYREAEATRSYLNTLIHNTPDLLLTLRPDYTIHVINPERLVSSRLGGGEIEGQNAIEMAPAHMHSALYARWQALQRGEPQSFEIEVADVNGRPLYVLLSAALIADYGEVFVIIKDVTDQREQAAQQHQIEKLAALGRLIAGAAHELNNPLAMILGLAQLQLGDSLPDELHDDFEKIERAALRARAIVQQMLSFARPQPPQTEPVPLRPLVSEALDRLAGALHTQQIAVQAELDPNLPPVSGDPNQLSQVLFNVLNNAVQSMSASPAEQRRLRVSASAADHKVLVAIEDSGPGIEPHNLPRIFDPFFTTRAIGKGTGLGLAISHAIVQQHNGQIWVNSQPGQGATFFIQLPIASAPAVSAAEAELALDTLAGARVLVVEDEEPLRDVVAAALKRHGAVVDAAAGGQEALALASAGAYALIISDLHMPGLDGPALYAQLRPHQPDQRWLIITGDTLSGHSQRFLRRTGLPVIAKPFTTDQLVRGVLGCLTKSPG